MQATFGEGVDFEPTCSFWLRLIPGERLIRELLATNIPSNGRNECFSPEGEFWATHHSIHYNEMPNFGTTFVMPVVNDD